MDNIRSFCKLVLITLISAGFIALIYAVIGTFLFVGVLAVCVVALLALVKEIWKDMKR